MKTGRKIFFLFTIFILAGAIFGIFFHKTSEYTKNSPKEDSAALSEAASPYKITTLDSAENITPGMDSSKPVDANTTPSLLAEEATLKYYYETSDYCYGITNDGREVFSHLDADGTKTDVLNGGGTITVRDTSDNILCQAYYLSKIERIEDAPVESVRVTYENSLEGSTFTTTYIFYDHYVKATATLNNFQTTSQIGVAFLERTYPNSYTDVDRKLSSNWVFPDNQDFPYKELDSYVTVHTVDNAHKLYTFYHGDDVVSEQKLA